MVRRTEVLRDGEWVELPFEQLKIGDTFRQWDVGDGPPRRVLDGRMGGVDTWECLSEPFGHEGCMQVACRPTEVEDGG